MIDDACSEFRSDATAHPICGAIRFVRRINPAQPH